VVGPAFIQGPLLMDGSVPYLKTISRDGFATRESSLQRGKYSNPPLTLAGEGRGEAEAEGDPLASGPLASGYDYNFPPHCRFATSRFP